MNADPVKYEVDKETGAIFVDRFMLTAMHYPCNYGYIPQTLSEDGDPADVLVVTPFPIQIGAVALPRHRRAGNGRRVGRRRQAAGRADRKALPAVPQHQVLRRSADGRHLPHPALLRALQGPGKGKWVKVKGWKGVAAAHEEILKSAERHNKA